MQTPLPSSGRRIRAGDLEREQVVDVLRTHYAQGRLELEEFLARVEAAYTARYLSDFDELLADLPALRPPSGPAAHPRWPRSWQWAALPAPLVILGIWVVIGLGLGALARGRPPFGLVWLIVLFWLWRPQRHDARRFVEDRRSQGPHPGTARDG